MTPAQENFSLFNVKLLVKSYIMLISINLWQN